MTKRELEQSLRNGLTLMVLPPDRIVPRVPFAQWKFRWATYTELKNLMGSGWIVVNEQKRVHLGG